MLRREREATARAVHRRPEDETTQRSSPPLALGRIGIGGAASQGWPGRAPTRRPRRGPHMDLDSCSSTPPPVRVLAVVRRVAAARAANGLRPVASTVQPAREKRALRGLAAHTALRARDLYAQVRVKMASRRSGFRQGCPPPSRLGIRSGAFSGGLGEPTLAGPSPAHAVGRSPRTSRRRSTRTQGR